MKHIILAVAVFTVCLTSAPAVAQEEPPSIFTEMSPEETQQYAAALREVVAQVRGKVVDTIADKIAAKQGGRIGQIAMVLFYASLLGAALLFAPLWLRRRHPNKAALLFKYGALAGALFFLAVNLFTGVLLLMRGSQAVTGRLTNPQVRIVDATFDLFAEKAEDVAAVGPGLIEPTLLALSGETDQPVLTVMLDNVQQFRDDLSVFSSVGRFFSKLSWLFGLLPMLLVGLAVAVILKTAFPTLKEIVKLPDRAASGEAGAGRSAVRATLQSVWWELKSTLLVIGVLVALTLLGGFLLSYVLMPAMEVFLAYLVVAVIYVQAVPEASTFWVMFSLLGSIIFLVLNLAVVLASSAFFLSKAQKIFQQKFRDGVPLRAHRRFWTWGTASVVWSQLLPLIYMLLAVEGIGWIVEKTMATENWSLILGLGPALFLLGFVGIFWAARGFKGLGFLLRYKPAEIGA